MCHAPHGAYYVMTDITGFGFPDDVAMTRHLVTNVGVACVPGSSFFRDPDGRPSGAAVLFLQEGRDPHAGGREIDGN